MATITDWAIIEEIKSKNGDNEEGYAHLNVVKIVEYENAGRIMWGIVFACEVDMGEAMANRYEVEGMNVHNGHVIWTRQESK